jgi:hypothetical protein
MKPDRDEILRDVTRILQHLTAEWGGGTIGPDARLGELGLESINYVYVIAEIQQRYHLRNRLYKELMERKTSLPDLRVADLAQLAHAVATSDDSPMRVRS